VTQDGTVRLPAPVAKRRGLEDSEIVAGRNPVVEALRAKVPATAVLLAEGIDHDERIAEILKIADRRQIPVQGLTRTQLDRLCDRAPHQGVALRVPEYSYAHTDDLIARAAEAKEAGLLVALDSVTDPRNLGAIVRSAAAFGAQGVVIPQRRAAGMTTAAWKTSAGAAARIPVASAVNLTRALDSFQAAGMLVAGLDVDGEIDLDDFAAATGPIVLVVGSEDKGLSRLVAKTCDIRIRIPISTSVESLNAGIATAVVLAEVARRRRAEG
jgi:23S rRNA (guanosine2251-2'-O)-methyltransferase